MEKIQVTHFGEDYAKVEVNGKEFEVSLGLGEALKEVLEQERIDSYKE